MWWIICIIIYMCDYIEKLEVLSIYCHQCYHKHKYQLIVPISHFNRTKIVIKSSHVLHDSTYSVRLENVRW